MAGKTAPDCIPSVWRPSTFWCYEVRDQVAIIASALLSVATSVYGGIAFYGRFTLGRQRLSALGVDLKHLKKVVEVFATAFLIDKVIRLHKRKDEITVKTLWRDIPFDQDMDRDVVAELQTQVAELQTQVDNLARFIRAHVQAGDAIVQQQPGGSSANDNCIHPAGAPSSSAVVAPGLLQPPTLCPPLNAVAVHESRHAPVQASREGHTRSPSPGAHTSNSTSSLSCAILKLMCAPTIVIPFSQHSRATTALLLLQAPRMSMSQQNTAGPLCPHLHQAAAVSNPRRTRSWRCSPSCRRPLRVRVQNPGSGPPTTQYRHQESIPSRLPQQALGMLVPLLIPLLSLYTVQLQRLQAEACRGIAAMLLLQVSPMSMSQQNPARLF